MTRIARYKLQVMFQCRGNNLKVRKKGRNCYPDSYLTLAISKILRKNGKFSNSSSCGRIYCVGNRRGNHWDSSLANTCRWMVTFNEMHFHLRHFIHSQQGKIVKIALFYPSFTDDILESFDTVKFLGEKTVDGEACFHLKTTNAEMEVQYWISNDAYFLPKRYLIIYKNNGNRQFQGTFSNWKLNPDLPDAVFEFNPPPMAKEIKILATNETPN